MKAIALAFCLFAATYAAPAEVQVATPTPSGATPTVQSTSQPQLPDGCRITSYLPNGQYSWECKNEWKVNGGAGGTQTQIPYCIPPPVGTKTGLVPPPGGNGGGMFGLGDFTAPGGTGLGFDFSNMGKGPLVGVGGSVGPGGYAKSVTLGGVKLTEQAHIPGMDNLPFKGVGTDIGIGGQNPGNPTPGVTPGGGMGLPIPGAGGAGGFPIPIPGFGK